MQLEANFVPQERDDANIVPRAKATECLTQSGMGRAQKTDGHAPVCGFITRRHQRDPSRGESRVKGGKLRNEKCT
jgi:hypothetical protein